MPLLDQAGVARVILSTRGKIKPFLIADLARRYPGRIVASVRTKGRAYADNKPGYYKLLNSQLAMPEFKAMAEILLWHAAKGNKAPEWKIAADTPQVQAAMKIAFDRGWPVVLHYEFAAAGWNRGDLMAELEGLLRAHPGHPFVLTHMGQLEADETSRLIKAHPNIHFIPSWSNTVTRPLTQQPWANLFEGRKLAAKWKALIVEHADRFVLGFDNVFEEHWGRLYVEQAALWRTALATLPSNVAHAIAHRNAERLWKLDPL